jgi:dipeptidase D
LKKKKEPEPMHSDISKLRPAEVWKHFCSLTRIPRPSGHEERIREFMSSFASSLGLPAIQDDAGNILVRKPATPGMENRKGVILQAHLDMVPQKKSGTRHDFTRDPIIPVIDGEWVQARGTTLGADNGIGVAAIMAVLSSSSLQHGPLEALLTSNEENGMTGAFGLEPAVLRGDILLNLDSEDEGELFTGCAGELEATLTVPVRMTEAGQRDKGIELRISGLKGGHSGMNIHLGRGNANKIITRILYETRDRYALRLASLHGGSLRNAIAREAEAVLAVPDGLEGALLDEIRLVADAVRKELALADPDIRIEAFPTTPPVRALDPQDTRRLIDTIYACPHGVLRMSDSIPGLVETSNNLARITMSEECAILECLLRSSVDSARRDIENMIRSVAELAEADILFDGGYPGWEPDPASRILEQMQDVYLSCFGTHPTVRAVHAGLECGIIGSTYPELDMISFGPTIRSPHSPDERVHIGSVERFWILLQETLKQVPLAKKQP